MKLLPRLLVLLLLCLIAITLPAAPVQAVCIAPPEVTLTPNWGVPGDSVAVTGEHCGENQWVDIHYAGTWIEEVRTNGLGRFDLTITIPESPRGKHDVLVAAKINNEVYEAVTDFTVWPGLTISPDKGPAGTTVTLTGRGFAEEETILDVRYYISGGYLTLAEGIPTDANGSWETALPIPASARGEHKIDAWGTQTIRAAVRHAVFEVTPGISIGASSGSAGQSITMKGSGFAPNEMGIRILFDGRAVRMDITASPQGNWQAGFEVPEKPKGTYIVTAEGESTWRGDVGELSFEIGPGIIMSPTEGHVGMELTVSGRGFAANQDVVITYEDTQVQTARTDEEGSFDVSFSVPESAHGERTVKAKLAADPNGTAEPGTNVSAIFTMESDPPPVPELVSPAARARVGFLYKATPTFQWSEVDDASQVYYSLQIAASAEVTPAGAFLEPMVSEEGLPGTSYTPETGPLPYGRYYWVVQAVDGAENQSGWSEVYSFRVGLLPRWAFIAAIVVLALLALVLIRLLIIRRTYYY